MKNSKTQQFSKFYIKNSDFKLSDIKNDSSNSDKMKLSTSKQLLPFYKILFIIVSFPFNIYLKLLKTNFFRLINSIKLNKIPEFYDLGKYTEFF